MAKSCVTNHLLVLHIPANGFYEDLIHNFPRGNGETGLTPEPQALLLALCEDESIFYPFFQSLWSLCSYLQSFSKTGSTFTMTFTVLLLKWNSYCSITCEQFNALEYAWISTIFILLQLKEARYGDVTFQLCLFTNLGCFRTNMQDGFRE